MFEFYISNNSPVYVSPIDASKPFDRVTHIKLFGVLRLHGIRPLFLRSLFNMYTRSAMHVRWKEALSDLFELKNGVKQGGCLSHCI